ncbi:uncharacterized protein LOC144066992 [Stigmatopora argus]
MHFMTLLQQRLRFLTVLRKQQGNTNLQRVINTAQKIINCPLPTLSSIYKSQCLRREIIKDNTHPGFHHFNLLPQGHNSQDKQTQGQFLPKSRHHTQLKFCT